VIYETEEVHYLLSFLSKIGFKKLSYLGQHNADGGMINPIIPIDPLFLGLAIGVDDSVTPLILDSILKS